MNIVEHVSLLHAGESSGYMPRSGIAGSSGREVPSFRGTARLISRVVVPICNPTSSEECSSFSTKMAILMNEILQLKEMRIGRHFQYEKDTGDMGVVQELMG